VLLFLLKLKLDPLTAVITIVAVCDKYGVCYCSKADDEKHCGEETDFEVG
jgi:hypothetical protein